MLRSTFDDSKLHEQESRFQVVQNPQLFGLPQLNSLVYALFSSTSSVSKWVSWLSPATLSNQSTILIIPSLLFERKDVHKYQGEISD